MNRILEVFVGLRRNFAMAFASIILIFLTLFLLGFALIITINTRTISSKVIESLKMHVFLETDITDEEIDEVTTEIMGLDGVKDVELSTKEDELKNIVSPFEDGKLIEDYFAGEKNPLNDVLNIEVNDDDVDMTALKLEIESLDNVESANYGEEFGADKLIESMNNISLIAIGVSVIFAIVTMFLIINTIKLTINSRRKEIEIMRLVGATKEYITFPFAFEGAFLGFVGGSIAFGVVYLVYAYFTASQIILSGEMVPASHLVVPLLVGQIIFGVLIGFIGAIIAIRNYLKV